MKKKKRNPVISSSVTVSEGTIMKKHRKTKSRQCLAGLLAMMVLLSTIYTMILPTLSMEQTVYCGLEEHTHTDECYEQQLICETEESEGHIHGNECYTEVESIICGLEESEGHIHGDECFTEVESNICGQEESEGHFHSDECFSEDGTNVCGMEEYAGHIHGGECFTTENICICPLEETAGHVHDDTCRQIRKELICTEPETAEAAVHEHTDECSEEVLICDKEEHRHELMCFSNPEADLETPEIWNRSVSEVILTDIWADNLAAIAESQIGYRESTDNYTVDDDGTIRGYTRYGAWYGDPYADWCAMFISFCLNYAGIPDTYIPYESSCIRWIEKLSLMGMYESAAAYTPQKGDLVFFNAAPDGTEHSHAAIVENVRTDEEDRATAIDVIEGVCRGTVSRRTCAINDIHIIGYGRLPENPDAAQTEEISAAELLAETDLAALTKEELEELLEQITPEDLLEYLGGLSDEEYDLLIECLSDEALEILDAFLGDEGMLLAAGDLYVGFSKTYSTGAIDFADIREGGGGGGVRKYYLIKKSVYDQYAAIGNYAAQQSLINQAEVAYCYNYYSATPNAGFGNPRAYYDEKQNASPSLFYNSTSSHRRIWDQNTLYNKILAVAMNGYPNDYSGIGARYGLSADEFRFITQYAVWYYTDSISINFVTKNGGSYYYMYADDTHTWLTVDGNGTAGYYKYYNQNIKLAYNELISSALNAAAANTSHINLYQKNSGSYQNLLTVGKENAPPPPPHVPNRLRLMKNVTGTAGNPEQEFHFTITVKDNDWKNLSGSYNVIAEAVDGAEVPDISSITFTRGVAQVELKHGQSITIDGLPDGFYYSITETEWNQGGYTSAVTEGSSSNMQAGDGGLGTVDVTFENHKDAPPTITSVRIPARKIIDGGQTPIGENRFRFRLTGNGQDLIAYSDLDGNVLFPEIIYTSPGTYTYTIEEIPDERDGVTFDFDKSKKTVTVTVSSHDVQTYDPDAVYYAFEELDENYEYYYWVDVVPGRKGIVMYCTYQGISGPQDPDGYSNLPAKDQTYRVVINPSVAEIQANGWVQQNLYGDALTDRLKKLFYYFETADSAGITNSDKQSLVWSATGKTSAVSPISVNGRPASTDAGTVLKNIYETVTLPDSYNLAFFVPTNAQAVSHPQPLATGYGAVVEDTIEETVFDNASIKQSSLKLEKNVTGTAGDRDRAFNFTINLKDNDWKAVSGQFRVVPGSVEGVDAPSVTSITFDRSGNASVSLKHGQNITIEGLPEGFYYTVLEAEMNQDGYTSSVTKGTSGNLTDRNGASGPVEVEFTNHKDSPPPPPISYDAEIKASKTLDGGLPADGQFTFILKNSEGVEVGREKNDANGEITFFLTFEEPGTYTYYIEELDDGQEGIIYDTEVKTVTVTVGSEQVQAIMAGTSFVGTNISDDFYITVNGTTVLDVYCIDGSAGYPGGSYNTFINPDSAQLAGEVTANNYGNALGDNMRKLLYYFDTHSYTDTIGYSTLSKVFRQELIWCLTGNPGQQHWSYTNVLNTILRESEPPSSYTVVMFASAETPKKQPVIAGYLPAADVTYVSRSGKAEFANTHSYELPETGGTGTTIYAIGGLLLMGGALLLMYRSGLVCRRKDN